MARDIKMTLSFLCLGHSSGTFRFFIFPAFSYVFSLCFLIVYLGILDFRKAPLPPKFFLFGKIEKAVPGTYIHRFYLVHIEFQGKPPTKQT